MAKWIDLPTHIDSRGHLTVVEGGVLPFEVRRVFYMWGIPDGAERGGHAHRACHQVLVAVSGTFTVHVNKHEYRLLTPRKGLYLPPECWRRLDCFTPDAACLVLCSEPYDPDDYIYEKRAAA
jgi:mannose-6-phosphate isomerase-like protein (cupin superfamily)